MAKRVVIVEIGGGNYGLRVSNPGQDAINGSSLQTSDKLAFDTLYPADGVFIDRIYDITVNANSSHTVNYGKTYDPFPFIMGTWKNGNTYTSDLFCVPQNGITVATAFTNGVSGATLGKGFYWETTGTQLTVYNETSSQRVFRLFLLTLGATGSTPPSLPNPPTILSVTNLSETSQRISYNTTAGTEETRMDVSTVSNFASFVYQNVSIGMTSPYDVTGLTGNTTYYYRLRAVDTTPNPDVTSLNSAVVSKKTAGVNSALGISGSSFSASDTSSPFSASCQLTVASDGRSLIDRNPGSDTTYYWYGSSPQSGVGNNYWVRFTETSYSTDSNGQSIYTKLGTATTWQQLSSGRSFGIQIEYDGSGFPVIGNAQRGIRAEISTNSSGTNIVSTFNGTFSADYSL